MGKLALIVTALLWAITTISCGAQSDNGNDALYSDGQNRAGLLGNWQVVSADKELLEHLIMKKDSFFIQGGEEPKRGLWRREGVQYLLLGEQKFRLFYKGSRMVLQDQSGVQYELINQNVASDVVQDVDGPISMFVRRIHKDSRGAFWFGTNGDGVARYNGKLEYFSKDQGFGGHAVRGIVEDEAGNVWFGTSEGITKYDGTSFTNYTSQNGLIHDDVWSITIDTEGIIWLGTLGGVCTFDGQSFETFELPESKSDSTRGVTSSKIVHSIMQDSGGRIWFGTNGGAYIWDENDLSILSEADGLCNNAVNCILEDDYGRIWFATHHNGVCIWDGAEFVHINESHGVGGVEVWDLYKEKDGDIWFPVENYGMYQYHSQPGPKLTFTNVYEASGLTSNAIQCTFESEDGVIWFGGYKGLFKYDGSRVVPVTKQGPWN